MSKRETPGRKYGGSYRVNLSRDSYFRIRCSVGVVFVLDCTDAP